MNLLFISNLYPSSIEPTRGLFNQRLIEAIGRIVEPDNGTMDKIDSRAKTQSSPRVSLTGSAGEAILCSRKSSEQVCGASRPGGRVANESSPVSSVLVIAPFQYFPGQSLLRGRTAPPAEEIIGGIRVLHPKVFYTPGFLIHKHWQMYQDSIQAEFRKMVEEFKPDHVMIGFAYPDGAAVAPLCQELGIPYSIRLNGSDFNLRIKQPKFREIVLKTLNEAPLIFCPGDALREAMIKEGVDGAKIHSFTNGVDKDLFKYRSKEDAAEQLSVISGQSSVKELSNQITIKPDNRTKCVLFVGNMVSVKAPDIMIQAFHCLVTNPKSALAEDKHCSRKSREQVCGASRSGDRAANNSSRSVAETTPERCSSAEEGSSLSVPSVRDVAYRLLIVGNGPMRGELERMASELGISEQVTFLGQLPPEQLALLMNLSDCLCLPSKSEGMPNVVLEACSSGLPVVASRAAEGVAKLLPESCIRIVDLYPSGREPDVKAFADAVANVLAASQDMNVLSRESIKVSSWEDSADGIIRILDNRL